MPESQGSKKTRYVIDGSSEEKIGKAIRFLRAKVSDLTLEELVVVMRECGADSRSVHKGNLAQWERGERAFSCAKLRNIADALGLEIVIVFDGKKPEGPEEGDDEVRND